MLRGLTCRRKGDKATIKLSPSFRFSSFIYILHIFILCFFETQDFESIFESIFSILHVKVKEQLYILGENAKKILQFI